MKVYFAYDSNFAIHYHEGFLSREEAEFFIKNLGKPGICLWCVNVEAPEPPRPVRDVDYAPFTASSGPQLPLSKVVADAWQSWARAEASRAEKEGREPEGLDQPLPSPGSLRRLDG